jgi:ketosteroid isomerase-like protein
MGRHGKEDPIAATRIEAVRGVYSAFNEGDIESVIALMSSDVDWANPMEGGRGRGHEAIRRTWERLSKQFACRVDAKEIGVDGRGRVVVDAAVAIRDATGKPLAHQRMRHIFSFRGEPIQRFDVREPLPPRR